MQPLPPHAVVLVTGSTSGIGLGIAQRIAEWCPHCDIFLNGLGTPNDIADAIALVNASRGDAEVCGETRFAEADLATVEGAEHLIHHVVKTSKRIDVLVNNAGIQHVSPIDEFPVQKYNQVVALNLSAVFHTMRVALRYMKAQGFGRIINIASTHGLTASPNKSAYVATKHAVIGLTKAVALEVARANITCNAVCPGWVLTPLVEKQIRARMASKGTDFDTELISLVGEKMPSGKPVIVEEIGDACVYLASPATRSTNGAALNIDGGWVAGTIGESEKLLLVGFAPQTGPAKL